MAGWKVLLKVEGKVAAEAEQLFAVCYLQLKDSKGHTLPSRRGIWIEMVESAKSINILKVHNLQKAQMDHVLSCHVTSGGSSIKIT